MKNNRLIMIILLIFLLSFCSAEHNITGFIENAKDETPANGHTILLWNPLVGIQDNLSDIIGPTGNSGINNGYSIDCELLDAPCQVDDILTVKVINNGDNYVSEEGNITVTSSPEDSVENITLNSPPTTNLIFPTNFKNISEPEIDFNCSFSDLDGNLKEINLYGNWTGEWKLNETKQINSEESFKTFTKILGQGFYIFNCLVSDNLSISSFFQQNNSFTVDLTKPDIDSVLVNVSYSCGKTNIARVNCTTYDGLLEIDKVIIEVITPSVKTNYSASFLTENTYYSDILLNETGFWEFNCISNDTAGNYNNLTSERIGVYSSNPELSINFQNISLNNSNPLENQSTEIHAIIENFGCGNAENIIIGFFEGNPDKTGENIGNTTLNITQLAYNETNLFWNARIGPTNIFVVADYSYLIEEEDENNNKANRTFSINSWQNIYGNTSVDKIIGNETENIKKWFNESYLEGNIFVTDSECSINWLLLQAIGRKEGGGKSSDDFSEIDELLKMEDFDDSVSNLFSDTQNPKNTVSMVIHQREIQEIPIINSTDNSNFVTGILWDMSDDTDGVDGEFDVDDKEDIVFVAKINKETEGAYGIYDYEIKIPAKLREYRVLDYEEIYLYYELN